MERLGEIGAEKLADVARVEAAAAALHSVPDSIQLLIDHLREITGADGVVLDLERDGVLVSCFATTAQQPRQVHEVEASVVGRCFSSGQILRTPNLHRDPRFVDADEMPEDAVSMITVPLHVHGPAVGLVRVMSSDESRFEDEDVAAARLMTGSIARIMMQAVREEVLRDEKDESRVSVAAAASGFADRRKTELRQAARYGYSVTIVHCRIDGYVTGEVLEMIPSLVRSTDGCFRLDATDFAILMPATSKEQAALVADRIRSQVEAAADGVRLHWVIPPEGSETAEVA